MAKKKWADFAEPLQYKIFYFMFYAGYMPLLLFLPVYFKYIGLTPIYVGILAAIRPVLQSIGTPFLLAVGEKFRSQKVLFVVSCVVMIGRVLIILLFLRPTYQRCTITYTNISDGTLREASHFVEHKLSKRSLVMDDWSRSQNDIANDNFIFGTNKIINGEKLNKTLHQNITANTSSHLTNNNIIRSTLAHPTKKANDILVEYSLVNDKTEVYHIFIALLILGLLGDSFEATVFTLVDHSYTANMEIDHYGITRLWGNLGWGVITPIIGAVMYYFNHVLCGETVSTFHYVFYFFIGFSNIALLVGSHLDFTSTPIDKFTEEIHGALSNFQYGIFLFASSYSGFCNGFLFTFVNWFIDSLGGSALIMGIATGCKGLVDVVLFFLLKKIIDYFGHIALITISFFGHILVFLVFYAIEEPWLVVVGDTLHAMVYAVMTSTCISFLIQAAPAGSSPRMQGMIYYGI